MAVDECFKVVVVAETAGVGEEFAFGSLGVVVVAHVERETVAPLSSRDAGVVRTY